MFAGSIDDTGVTGATARSAAVPAAVLEAELRVLRSESAAETLRRWDGCGRVERRRLLWGVEALVARGEDDHEIFTGAEANLMLMRVLASLRITHVVGNQADAQLRAIKAYACARTTGARALHQLVDEGAVRALLRLFVVPHSALASPRGRSKKKTKRKQKTNPF